MLTDKIQQDIITALKAKDEKKLSCLRFLSAAIKNKQIDSQKELTDENVASVIRKQIKELKEANIMFEKAGRNDLVENNNYQIRLLSSYLPAEISDEELKKEIDKLIADNQDIYNKNPKAIIGIAVKTLKDKASPERIMKIIS